jgi:hypothetical protein
LLILFALFFWLNDSVQPAVAGVQSLAFFSLCVAITECFIRYDMSYRIAISKPEDLAPSVLREICKRLTGSIDRINWELGNVIADDQGM